MSRAESICTVAVLSFACVVPPVALAQETMQQKQERIALNSIRKTLPIKQDKDKTWYVIQLETITSSTRRDGSFTTTSVRSSVQLEKIQGQDAAARRILEFLTSPTPGKKIYYRDAFADTPESIRKMEKHIEQLKISGALKGYR